MARNLGFYGDGICFRVVFSQSSWLRVLPGGAGLVQPGWTPGRRILGDRRTCGVSSWPFLNSPGWWWLISSVFFTRTSCPKTTHANGNYGAWPGWAVSITVLPLTKSQSKERFHWPRFPGGPDSKASACNVGSLGREDSLEKEMATHSSTLSWKIPWTEEPGRLWSMRSQWVRHDWATSVSVGAPV